MLFESVEWMQCNILDLFVCAAVWIGSCFCSWWNNDAHNLAFFKRACGPMSFMESTCARCTLPVRVQMAKPRAMGSFLILLRLLLLLLLVQVQVQVFVFIAEMTHAWSWRCTFLPARDRVHSFCLSCSCAMSTNKASSHWDIRSLECCASSKPPTMFTCSVLDAAAEKLGSVVLSGEGCHWCFWIICRTHFS